VIQETLRQRRASVGLDMHAITNYQGSTRLESDDAHGTDVGGEMQRLTVSGRERSRTIHGGARARIARRRWIDGMRFDGVRAKTQAWPEGARDNQ